MKIILLLLIVLLPAFLDVVHAKKDVVLESFSIEDVEIEKNLIWLVWVAVGLSIAVGVYTFYQMRKMQKQQKQQNAEASQIDGSIADYGVKTSSIGGTVWMNANHIDVFGQATSEIHKSTGGGGKK